MASFGWFVRQNLFGPSECIFLYDALIFFKRTFNSVHVLAVLIRHEGYDLVAAGSRITDTARHYFTNFELAHIAPPPNFATPSCRNMCENCGGKMVVTMEFRLADAPIQPQTR
jgi:hypothetical protein